MKINQALLVFLLAVWGCGKPLEKFPVSSEVYGLMMPVWLHTDTTEVVVADFFSEDGNIDSFNCEEGISCYFNGDSSVINVVKLKSNRQLFGLNLYKKGFAYHLVLKNRPMVAWTFNYQSESNNAQVAVKGDFNGWNDQMNQLVYNEESGLYSNTIQVSPGEYGYQFVVDGHSILDPLNKATKSNGMGGTNSLLEAKLSAPGIEMFAKSFEKNKLEIALKGKTDIVKVLWENFLLNDFTIDSNSIHVEIPSQAANLKRSFLRIYAANEYGHGNDVLIPLENGIPVMRKMALDRNDLEKTVMYFMMIDRFFDADSTNNFPLKDQAVLPKANYYGGDLKGVLEKIKTGFFDDLGINALWISPIAQNPLDAWGQFRDPDTKFSGYHGYWPISSSQVDFRFGNEKILKELLSEAHKKGINVYLDYVANHVHKDHPLYKKHPDWATSLYLPDGSLNTERWDDHRLTTWFDTFMPTLNLENAQVAEFMSDSALFWIKNYDFDGFRHDATKHIPESFWRIVTRKMKNEVAIPSKRRMYQIGETYGNPSLISGYLGTGLLDAQFDFNLYDVMLPAFAYNDGSFINLAKEQQRSLSTYGYHHLMGNISGNQDKPRFMSFADGSLSSTTPWLEYKRIGWKQTIDVRNDTAYDKMALFQTYLLTIPGIPVIYYGDEIGMPGAGDPDNRRMMTFSGLNEKQVALKDQIKRLIQLRNNYMSLIYGDFNFLKVSKDQIVYTRRYFDEIAVICINKSNAPYTTQLNLPNGFGQLMSDFKSNKNIKIRTSQQGLVIDMVGNSSSVIIFKSK